MTRRWFEVRGDLAPVPRPGRQRLVPSEARGKKKPPRAVRYEVPDGNLEEGSLRDDDYAEQESRAGARRGQRGSRNF